MLRIRRQIYITDYRLYSYIFFGLIRYAYSNPLLFQPPPLILFTFLDSKSTSRTTRHLSIPPDPHFLVFPFFRLRWDMAFLCLLIALLMCTESEACPFGLAAIYISLCIYITLYLLLSCIYIYISLSLSIYIYMYKKRGRLTNYVLFLDYTASDRAPHLPDGRRARLHGHAL